ncbi:outer membrane beta-barrel protein [Belnapia rosea]|uniref:Beta-barrel porin 2 n=1 Tax=Belnapia rosea TaxID=938405 RepID=A0A1G6PNX0_9PROT|nr:outer membrane beta-barrel protein [Belnapia rosea]SDC81334.1 hypothetical protein SAMN04487779_1002446 [Belnapia rosea]
MKSFPSWGLLGLMVAALPVGEARAQLGDSPEVARGITVVNRQRPDFDPLGVRLGGFRLNGAVEAGPGWDSNIFGRRRNVVSDGFVEERGNLSLRSDWTTHAAGISANSVNRQYFSESRQDWNDWDLGGFGRYDFSADTALQAAYRHYRAHLDVYNFDVQSAGIVQPVAYNSDEVSVVGNTRLNRLGLIAQGVYRTFDFEDTVIRNTLTPVSQNSFNTAIGAVGGSYSLAPGRNITTIVRVQDIKYTDNISSRRDSFTWEALAGFDYDFDGVWQARVALGWRQREYSGPNLKTLEGPAVEAAVTYAPTQLTTARFRLTRTIEESIRQDAVSYQRTQIGLTLDHEYLRNVLLQADLLYDRREYESPNQTASDGVLTLTARYLLNRNATVVASYGYRRRIEATGGFQEFDRNLLQLRLRLAI